MYSDQDFQLWIYLYVEKRFSCQWISDQTNVPVSTIKKLTTRLVEQSVPNLPLDEVVY